MHPAKKNFIFLTFGCILLLHNHLSVASHALSIDVHLLAGGVVVELHFRFALSICTDIRIPVYGASEVRHRRDNAIVLRLESGDEVEPLEVCASDAFVAGSGEALVGVEVDSNRGTISLFYINF